MIACLLTSCTASEPLPDADWGLRAMGLFDSGWETLYPTAVGGTQAFYVRDENREVDSPIVARSRAGVFEVDNDPLNGDFTLHALRGGSDTIVVESDAARASFQLEARQARRLRVYPNVRIGGDEPEFADSWQAFRDSTFLRIELLDEGGGNLVDESITLNLGSSIITSWDVHRGDIPEGETFISSPNYEGLTQPAIGVSEVDRIELLNGPSELAVGETEYFCFRAYKNEQPVWSVPWDFGTNEHLEFLPGDPGFFPGDEDCAEFMGASQGAGTISARVSEVELNIDLNVRP